MPGPGPQITASHPRTAIAWWIAPAVLIASSSPPNDGAAVMCPASSPRARRSRTTREWPPGSAPPAVWMYPTRPSDRPWANAQAIAGNCPWSPNTAAGRSSGIRSSSLSTGRTACCSEV